MSKPEFEHKTGIFRSKANAALYDKALNCAINQSKTINSKKEASSFYYEWECFRDDVKFKECLQILKKRL